MAIPQALTVLVVEDDPDIRTLVTMALSLDPGFKIMIAEDGSSALRQVKLADPLDVVLIDNGLPDMDGVELAHRIARARRNTAIVFLTASVRDRDRALYAEVAARGIIGKPFDPLALAAQIRACLDPSESHPTTSI